MTSDDEAFRTYLDPSQPGYVRRWAVDIEDAIDVLARAGGVTVIAHPRDTSRGPGVSDARLAELVECGLAGIEADHQSHSEQTRRDLHAVAHRLGVIPTGASDHHGSRKNNHDLGCNLTAPEGAERLLGRTFSDLARDGLHPRGRRRGRPSAPWLRDTAVPLPD